MAPITPSAAEHADDSHTIKKKKKDKKAKKERTSTEVTTEEDTKSHSKKSDKKRSHEHSSDSKKSKKIKKSDKEKDTPSAEPSVIDEEGETFLKQHSITVIDEDKSCSQLRPFMSFEALKIDNKLKEACFESFKAPTPIQAAAWPYLFQSRDLIGIARTGSGKTLAFGLPGVCKLDPSKSSTQMLVISPTRELAIQIKDAINPAIDALKLKSVVLYGGSSKQEQSKQAKGAQLVVATPGRLLDLIESNLVNLKDVQFLVLDEADRMLEQGFEMDVKRIMEMCQSSTRQTLMFSATWPQSIRKLASTYLKNPIRVNIGSTELTAASSITQTVHVLQESRMKDGKLLSLLTQYGGTSNQKRILVFVLYKKESGRVEGMLARKGYNCESLSGDKTQDARMRALEAFKSGRVPILIATDVAGRGLDIPEVSVVINYTFPLTIEDYVHRIGRTGRGSLSGISHTFFTPLDKSHAGNLINTLKSNNQPVPENLLAFGTTVKKKQHDAYGAFYKDVGEGAKKATKIVFGDDDDE